MRALIAPLVAGTVLVLACDQESNDAGAGGAASTVAGVGGSFAVGSGTGGFEACAEATIEGDRVPVQMYIMFDKSGSMLDDQKWAGATAALTAFFQDDDSAGLSIALRFFPDDEPTPGCNESACDVGACATPLVALGTLNELPAHSDPQQKALVEAVQSRQPGGQTPMFAALGGATDWAIDHAVEGAKTVVVLVTDGEPNGCDTNVASIANLAAQANAQAGVLTYAIGMHGANIAQLDQIASAGGTKNAFVVGAGTVHKDLVAAFETIGIAPLECVMPLPDPEKAGAEVNPGEINVSFTPTSGASETIPQVSGAGDCAGEGWYYDDPAMPTQIELCPASCEAVQGDAGASLDIVLGCKTVVK